jgi:hypothetical protein
MHEYSFKLYIKEYEKKKWSNEKVVNHKIINKKIFVM